MRLSTSRVLSTVSNSGFRTPAAPTSASMAVPPRDGFGTVATGWHPTSTSTAAAPAAAMIRLREMGSHPDEGQRADQEGGDQPPGGPVDLALEATTGAITAAQPAVSSADRSTKARRLRRLDQHPRRQEEGEDGLGDDEGLLNFSHGT